MIPRACIVVGHEKKAPGAESVSGESEYDFNCRLAPMIVARLARGGKVDPIQVMRDSVGYSRLPASIDQYSPLCAVELHFNAADGKARGTEMLHWRGSARGAVLAGLLQKAVVATLGTKDRGIKARLHDDRGGYLLGHTKTTCVIAEPFFGDNSADFNRGHERMAELAGAVASAVEEFVGMVLAGGVR